MSEAENRFNSNIATNWSATAMQAEEPALPDHLIRLPGTHWALWSWIGLRGAGFPANGVLKLGAPECADAAAALLAAEVAVEEERLAAIQAVKDKALQATGDDRDALEKALRRLQKGKIANPPAGMDSVAALVQPFTTAKEEFEATRRSFSESYDKAIQEVSQAIRQAAGDPRLQEAVIWQNRRAFDTGIASILRRPADETSRGSKQRQHEEMVASYLQRYCLKNDTIGFFGPVGWAQFVKHGEALVTSPGSDILAERNVYFEVWGLDELCNTLMADERMRQWVAPRRMSHVRVEDGALCMPSRKSINLSVAQARIIEACDGSQTAKQIAEHLLTNGCGGIKSEADVFELLSQLETSGFITWTLEASVGPFPEQSVREQLERIGDPELRAEAEDKLAQLEAARRLVAQAGGDPQKLNSAFSHLEETFVSLTGAAATRAAGGTYAGRTLVYEDCRRDIDVTVGPAGLEALGEPLSLLLESSRWFAHAVTETYLQAFNEQYEMLARKAGSTEVDLPTFWAAVRPMVFEKDNLTLNVLPEFQRRWSSILNVPSDEKRVQYRSEELRSRVLETFKTPPAYSTLGRYHNPDVMIAAPDAEAVRREDFLYVLGELHIGANTLGVSLFMQQHPAIEELFRAVDFDMPRPRLVPLLPKYFPHVTPRLAQMLFTSRDYRLEMAPGPFDVPPSHVLAIGQLVVKRAADGELIVRTRDGRLTFDIIEAFASAIGSETANHFKPLPPAEHTPRVCIDKLVVCRETWCFPASDMWFAFEKEAPERFMEARRWAVAHDVPRFVFVKAKVELKPFYVDLASPIYVELLGKVIRRCVEQGLGEETVTVSEMLPGPGESWLPDASGERYSSELRVVAVCLDWMSNGRNE